MKVLLLQEMSGVHTELRSGLRKLGIKADLATLGDGYKAYRSDISLGKPGTTILSSFNRAFSQLYQIPKILSYDIIQSISPSPYIFDTLIDDKITINKKKVYIAAGSDPIYLKYVRELDYFPPHAHFDRWTDNERNLQYEKFKIKLANSYSKIIPVCWEYKYALGRAGLETESLLPFPIDIEKFVPVPRKDNVLKIFHPLNRRNLKYDFKGTLLIKQAFEDLQKKYPWVEFIIKGGMSHDEYDYYTNQMDIIVDQCYSYSYGMSAALGLAKGKVVLSGLESAALEVEYYAECPIINIKPDVKMIRDEIEKLILNPELVKNISEKSRVFAEEFHDHKKVAEKYLKIYEMM